MGQFIFHYIGWVELLLPLNIVFHCASLHIPLYYLCLLLLPTTAHQNFKMTDCYRLFYIFLNLDLCLVHPVCDSFRKNIDRQKLRRQESYYWIKTHGNIKKEEELFTELFDKKKLTDINVFSILKPTTRLLLLYSQLYCSRFATL